MKTLNWRILCTVLFLSLFHGTLFAQLTLTTGANWKDALLLKSLKTSEAYMQSTNYNTYPRLGATVWTHSSSEITYRSLIRFELSAIPAGAIVQSAKLYLNSDPANASGELSNQSLTGTNSIYFQKVTQAWNPASVTWDTQPATTTANRIWVAGSASATENIQVDITSLVQDMVNNPASNFGIMMLLENELHYRSRNYASTDHTNSALHPKLVINYSTSTDPVKQRMDYIFGGLDQSYINTGILTDYGIDLADVTQFDGVIRTDNEVDINRWRALYASLLTSVINPSSNMMHLKTINDQLDNYWSTYDKQNPVVDVPAMFVSYQSLRSDALTQNLLTASSDRLSDVPGRTQSPYTTGYAFAAAPTLGYDEDGSVSFAFRSSLFVNSSSKVFSSLQVDFGDGSGYQAITLDVLKQVNYTTAGSKTIRYKIQFTDGSTYLGFSRFNVLNGFTGLPNARYAGANARTFTFPRATDVNCPEPGFPNPEVYNGSFYGAQVTVEYGTIGNRPSMNCTPQFIRPFIVVEGFDVSKFSAFGIKNWNYGDFISSNLNGGIFINGGPNNLLFSDNLQIAGYDLIFVDLNEGTGDIIRNAYLLENIIRWVNAHKIVNPNTNVRDGNVVLGQSMGGLIARYAVCDLEKRTIANPATNPSHEVRLLATHDTPHRGANVPLGFQAMVNDLANQTLTTLGLVNFGSIGAIVGSHLEMKDVVPALNQADKLLDEPAAQQMLIAQDGRSNSFLDGAYRSMVTFNSGYTPTFTMRALSNGSECGAGQSLQAGGELLYMNADLYVNTLLFLGATEAVANAVGGNSTVIPFVPPGLGVIVRTPFYLLMPFTGKTWKTSFTVSATPSSGVNQAYNGSIACVKKILFLIPVSINIFNGNRSSVSGALPIDSSPGGYYDLQEFKSSFPGNPNINAYPLVQANLTIRLANTFNFVPTFSALDVNVNPVPVAVLSAPFTNGSNATYPSRFSNFVTQERIINANPWAVNNNRHIQFTGRNAGWLLNEMENLPQTQSSCSYTCAGNGGTITGPDIICSAQGKFTLNNASTGIPVTWTNSTNLNYVSGQGTNVYTVYGNAVGGGTVTATLTGACGSTIGVTKSVGVGTGVPPSSITVGRSECYDQRFSTDFADGAAIYDWTVIGPSGSTFYPKHNYQLITGLGSGTYSVVVSSSCPSANAVSASFTVDCSAGPKFVITPNPSSDMLTVSQNTVAVSTSIPDDFEVTLVDNTGNISLPSAKSKNGQVDLDIRHLKKGPYILRIQGKNEDSKHHVLIK